MTTRRDAGSESGVPSGFGGWPVTDKHESVPACTIEDVDRALFKTFDEEINFEVIEKNGTVKKVPVIFATGERFALVKRRKPIRDETGAIILPIISIRRTQITQEDITERGINQFTGDIVVKKKLAPEDVFWQRSINKQAITAQDDAALDGSVDFEETLRMRALRDIGADARTISVNDGALLASNLSNNVFEFITIPQPQFYIAHYEITFSTQYTLHMNHITQRLIESYLPQGKKIKITSPKGYWFIATFDESMSSTDTLDDFSEKERMLSTTIECSVQGYMINGGLPGDPNAARRWLSAPQIRFDVQESDRPTSVDNGDHDNPGSEFLLNSIEKNETQKNARERNSGDIRTEKVLNPFSRKKERRFIKESHVDPGTGESIFKSS